MTSQRARNRLVERLKATGIKNPKILNAIASTPRHIFVDEALASRAYEDTALPIGYSQTISQPYVVAKMTEALICDGNLTNTLEIGTGCGYQAAIISQFTDRIITIERIEGLHQQARKHFRKLNLSNIICKYGDGYAGWKAKAPFDSIIVTAAPPEVPESLLRQLAIGGRMVIPVGQKTQELWLITRTQNSFEKEVLDRVNFVPFLTGIS